MKRKKQKKKLEENFDYMKTNKTTSKIFIKRCRNYKEIKWSWCQHSQDSYTCL